MVAKSMYVAEPQRLVQRAQHLLPGQRPPGRWRRTPGSADLYPTGEGLLAFATLDEAAAGVEEIAGDPSATPRGARAGRGALRLRQGAQTAAGAGMSTPTVALFGSCVTRDLFEAPDLRPALGSLPRAAAR